LELRAARKAAGLSQRDLSQRLRVPHSWVAKVETAERRIDLIEFCWFLRACDSDPLDAATRIVRQSSMTNRKPSRGGRRK
jgi:transcriptional regulator with XRE-family HTH domain